MASRKTSSTHKKSSDRKKTVAPNKAAARKKPNPGSRKKSTRKYSRASSAKVERSMHEMKEGKLRSGQSGKKVTNPKQAIAIGLSEARSGGEKVPKKKS